MKYKNKEKKNKYSLIKRKKIQNVKNRMKITILKIDLLEAANKRSCCKKSIHLHILESRNKSFVNYHI